MARTTKQLSGAGKDKFLRGLIASETGISSGAAEALGDKMCEAIADVRVRRDTWEQSRHARTNGSVAPAVAKVDPAAATRASPSATSEAVSSPAIAAPPQSAQSPASPFDPFAFSALAVLTKKGRTALAELFGAIDSIDDLHAIAAAQHLTVDAGLRDLPPLREALVAATEARLAERRAAAS